MGEKNVYYVVIKMAHEYMKLLVLESEKKRCCAPFHFCLISIFVFRSLFFWLVKLHKITICFFLISTTEIVGWGCIVAIVWWNSTLTFPLVSHELLQHQATFPTTTKSIQSKSTQMNTNHTLIFASFLLPPLLLLVLCVFVRVCVFFWAGLE